MVAYHTGGVVVIGSNPVVPINSEGGVNKYRLSELFILDGNAWISD